MWENRAVTPVQLKVQPFHALQNVAQVAQNVAQSVAQSVSQTNSAHHTTQFQAVPLGESTDMLEDTMTTHAENVIDVESLEVSEEPQFAYMNHQRRPLHSQVGLFSFNMFGTTSGLPTPRAPRAYGAYGAYGAYEASQNMPCDIQANTPTHATPYACEDVDMPDADLGNSAC